MGRIADFDSLAAQKLVSDALLFADGGELFLECCQQEIFCYSDGVLSSTDFSDRTGFGLRAFVGDRTVFVHCNGLDTKDLSSAADTVKKLSSFRAGGCKIAIDSCSPIEKKYDNIDPMCDHGFDVKIGLLQSIDAYLRKKSPLIKQVKVTLSGSIQEIKIITADMAIVDDCRPMVKLNIMVIVQQGNQSEIGAAALGGRFGYEELLFGWQVVADRALSQAIVNLDSVPVKAGEMTVVLGSGFPGVLLHEAVGHGLEGDANRKQSSAFCGLMGKRVAAPGVTVVDNGTLWARRGSLNIDDEGNPSQCNVLIEDGILVSYMNDNLNGRLLGTGSTGNGRRETYADVVMPRMTNTYMLGGVLDPQEIIQSVKKGVYAVDFGGGQVDTTSGKFVFSASEAYAIENGEITTPLKRITLIGSGPEALKKITMIGNDMNLDAGTGLCGKAGQNVPVCVGQPTIRLDGITVGGSKG